MNIAFCWDWEPYFEQTVTWKDGLAAALLELQKRGHEVRVFTAGKTPTIVNHPYFDIIVSTDLKRDVAKCHPDVILHWGDFTRPNAEPLKTLGVPMAICFAGGEAINYNTPLFDHIFVESRVYQDTLEERGYDNVSIAFGTNTDLFVPLPNQKIRFDTIFPATFAEWKRHNLYAEATEGLRSLAVGHMYHDHEQECWQVCLQHGVTVLPYVPAGVMRYLYAASRVCVIPSRSGGGSQRTVLEAMAMNLPVVVTDSDKFDFGDGYIFRASPDASEIRMFVEALLDGDLDVNTREFVESNWSHINYADSIEKGLKAII